MAGMNALIEKLRNAPKTSKEHRESELAEWRADLETLVANLALWLEPAVKESLVRLEHRTISLDELQLGTYTAPALTIHLDANGPRHVEVMPRGLRVVDVIPAGDGTELAGASGRVDLRCGPARAILLRSHDRRWKLVARDRGPIAALAEDLTEESLAALLGELVE